MRQKGFHRWRFNDTVRCAGNPRGSKVFVPLKFDPGEAIQVAWGQGVAIINGERNPIHLFCMRLCHSISPFVVTFSTEREEAFFEAHIQGLSSSEE